MVFYTSNFCLCLFQPLRKLYQLWCVKCGIVREKQNTPWIFDNQFII